MATTTVLLREDVDNLGGRGEIVKVKAGYARNFLIPQKMATLATKGNVKQVETERAALLKKAATERATAEAQAEQIKTVSLTFERKSGEHGILYGSVTTMDIAEALQAKGYEIDRRRLSLSDTIKELGDYTVKVKLHRDVTIELPIEVLGEGGVRAEKKSAKKVEGDSTPQTEAESMPDAETEMDAATTATDDSAEA
ncbi:MAG: 50S ribosomal protein L9 [Pyrinomonadaceae bacterium]